jgi:ribosomal protein S18 acetylase RimI-like enzyme
LFDSNRLLTLNYRLFAHEDFAQLYSIEEACFQPPLRFSRRYMRLLVSSVNAATWIAEESGQLAGFAIVEWAEEAGAVLAYIQTIEVAAERRGKGAGAELLRLIESSAETAGAQAIWLHVSAENPGAIRLYESHGYLPQGREENYYASGLTALVYRKEFAAEKRAEL